MYATAEHPAVTTADRLGLTLFFAIIAHAIVILGVTFTQTERPRTRSSTLDIVLVQQRSEVTPDEVDYLAQTNQDGGGDSRLRERPATPLPAPLTGPEANIVTAAPPAAVPPPVDVETESREPTPPDVSRVTPKAVLAQNEIPMEHKVATLLPPRPKPKPRRLTPRQDTPTEPAPAAVKPAINAANLISRSLAMASLSAEIDRKLHSYAKRPRRKWISARTRENRYASYMDAWRSKVERIGNLNYPDQARRKRLSGSLLLDVALNANGTVNDIVLRRSSGHPVLDDAAMRIVRLAAPYSPFPKGISKETDILHIERTWQFLASNRLASK